MMSAIPSDLLRSVSFQDGGTKITENVIGFV